MQGEGGGEGGLLWFNIEMLFPPWDIARGAQRLHLQCTVHHNNFDNFGQI